MVLVMRTGRLRGWMPGERIDEDALRWDYSTYQFYFPNLLMVLLMFKSNVSISFVLLDYKRKNLNTKHVRIECKRCQSQIDILVSPNLRNEYGPFYYYLVHI
jgi:hypothetical protein